MSTDFFRRYLDLLNEAETTGRLIGNQPFIPGKPLSPMQMATVDFARSMGNQMGPEVDRAYDLAKQSGVKPGGQSDSTTNKSDVSPTNARSDRAPNDFTPTHFHKNNLGSKIPLMQTPDGSFWWETTATGDDGGPVQRGGARKSIQPWIGDTENRSSGFSGKSSVDGVFKNGQAIEFPEGMTWKEYAASAAKSPQAALPAAKSKQIEPELLAPLEPTDSGRKLVAPNTSVALPSSGTFSNDQALANLAAQIKNSTAEVAKTTGSKTDSPESLEILRKIKALAGLADALPPIDLTKDPDQIYAAIDMDGKIMQQLTSLVKQAGEIINSGGDMSDITKQQVKDISISTTNKMLARIRSVTDKFGGEEKAVSGPSASGSASGAVSGSGSGAQWAYVPGDGTSKDISGKKDGSGLPAAAEIGTGTAGAAASKKTSKETMITDSSRCAQCGTPKSIHTPLKHQFVPGDDVRPGAVGGSQSSSDRSTKPSTDTLAADQARIDKMDPYDRSTRRPVGAKTAPTPRPRPPPPLNEDINRLPVVDQMRSWRQLMEAPSGPTAAQQAAQRAALGRPGSIGVGNKPDVRSLNDKARDVGRQRFGASPEIDRTPIGSTQLPSSAGSTSSTTSTAAQPRSRDFTSIDRRGPRPPPPPPELPGFAQSRIQGRPTGTAASVEPMAARGIPGMDATPAASPTPPAAPADWKAKVKLGLRKIAAPAAAAYSVYEGWNKISALPKDKMSRAQYSAEVTKIVAKLVEENGIVLVSTWLGGLAGGAITGGAGAIPGMVVGATSGIAAEYWFGDDISKVVNGVVDYMYGTDKTPTPAPAPAPQENKLTSKQIADYKAYVENTERWLAERTTWSPADQAADPWTREDQAKLDQFKSLLKAAGVTVAPIPQPPPQAPAADPVAEVLAELQSIVTELDKIYADQTPLPGETGKTELAKITALIAKNEAVVDKIAKLPPDPNQRALALVNAENLVTKKIYLAQRSVLHRSLLQDTDPAVYAKHKAGADKLMAFEAEVNDLDVKDPDFQKKALALARQINQMIDSLPDVPEGDRGAYMVRQQSLTAARDTMQRKQKEYEDYRAKNPAPAPATGGFKEGDTGTIPGNPPKKVIFKNGKWVPQ